jgi:biotin carboxylase
MRVLVLSHTTGYQLRAFNDAAERLGFDLLFATDRCHKLDDPWQDRAVPVKFHDLDVSVDRVVERAREFPVDGLIAVGDRPVVLAARVAEAVGIRWHSPAGAAASTDKRRSRAALAAAGLPSPRFTTLHIQSETPDLERTSNLERTLSLESRTSHLAPRTSSLDYPMVLKPLGLSGSRGVIRANDEEEFEAAFSRIAALLARPQVRSARSGLEDAILVEEYIPGREFAVEGVLTDGSLRVFAIFDKPDPLEGPFFEETIYVTPSRLPAATQEWITEAVQRAAAALGLQHGPVHAECRLAPDGEVYVLEIAARPIGGICSRVLTFTGAMARDGFGDLSAVASAKAEGGTLEEVLLQHAVGRPIHDYSREARAAAVMMIPIGERGLFKGVSGDAEARRVPGITEVTITAKIGQLLEPLPEAGSYLGFIFARGATPSDAEAAVRAAHQALEFAIARDLAVNR